MAQNLTDHTDFFPYSREVKHTQKNSSSSFRTHSCNQTYIVERSASGIWPCIDIFNMLLYLLVNIHIYWILCSLYLNQAFEEMSERQKTFQVQHHSEIPPLIIFCILIYPVVRHMNTCLVQFSSVAQLCPILCDPMNYSTPGLPVHHQLPEFTQTHVHRVGDAIQPSHPLSSASLPAFNLSQNQGLFQ